MEIDFNKVVTSFQSRLETVEFNRELFLKADTVFSFYGGDIQKHDEGEHYYVWHAGGKMGEGEEALHVKYSILLEIDSAYDTKDFNEENKFTNALLENDNIIKINIESHIRLLVAELTKLAFDMPMMM